VHSSFDLDRSLERLHASEVDGLQRARHVAATSVTIASALHIGEPLLGHVWRAGLLHDVGALAVPGVLVRIDGLLAASPGVARLRILTAAEALQRVPYLVPVAPMVATAGERFDGGGWPLGLRGTAIPIGARIVAVAAAFERSAAAPCIPGNPDAAHAGIVREAGAAFDPEIVAALLHAADVIDTVTC
jgi:response regulator RpfG family c-di-GMP phosphodiesterase